MSVVRAWRDLSMTPALLPLTRWRVAARWRAAGRPLPPPHVVKQRQLLRYQRMGHYRTMVETGTFTGEMVEAMRRHFDRIISIELSPEYHAAARRRFEDVPNVELLLGDSGILLPRILETIHEPGLFWLDGHWAGVNTARGDVDTPISAEIGALLRHPVSGHAVLVDDARLFVGTDGYPTLDAFIAGVRASRPAALIRVEADAICCILNHE